MDKKNVGDGLGAIAMRAKPLGGGSESQEWLPLQAGLFRLRRRGDGGFGETALLGPRLEDLEAISELLQWRAFAGADEISAGSSPDRLQSLPSVEARQQMLEQAQMILAAARSLLDAQDRERAKFGW